ncbi:hypothetical protein RBB50_004699 [Rhinocladiella similis]
MAMLIRESGTSEFDGLVNDDPSPLSDILAKVEDSPTNDTTRTQRTRTAPVLSKPIDLAVIQEDDGESLLRNPGLAAAPHSTVKGIKDADQLGGISKSISGKDNIRDTVHYNRKVDCQLYFQRRELVAIRLFPRRHLPH